MSSNALILSLVLMVLCPGCASSTAPESTSYEEWQQEQRARWEAKKTGTEYKTKAQVRKEAEEMRAIATDVINSSVKPTETKPE